MNVPFDEILKIIFAFAAGAMLGLEREYHDKPAGMRTIILITVGSTLFCLLNINLPTLSPDRIASTVVTGIGFLGAGVIFKEGINVHGLTTAATIWVAAAIGMALGFGNYWMAAFTLTLTLITLVILRQLEKVIANNRSTKIFNFSFETDTFTIDALEFDFRSLKIEFQRIGISKINTEVWVEYKLKMSKKEYVLFIEQILSKNEITKFRERS